MARPLIAPSLRRALLASAVGLVAIATLAMVVALSTLEALRNEIDRDTNAVIEEQRIADRITALTYQQQLEVFRFLQQSDDGRRHWQAVESTA